MLLNSLGKTCILPVSGKSGVGCRLEIRDSEISKLLSFCPKTWTLAFLGDWEVSGSWVLSSAVTQPALGTLCCLPSSRRGVGGEGDPAVVANSGRLLKMCVVLEMQLDLPGLTIGCHCFPGQVSSL